jgi:hypothetical protein
VKIGLDIGGKPPSGNDGMAPTAAGSSPGAMASAFRELSNQDQYAMTKKCGTVLAMPSRFNSDIVALCRIIATL